MLTKLDHNTAEDNQLTSYYRYSKEEGSFMSTNISEFLYHLYFSSVQSLSRVRLFATPMNRSTPGLPLHHQLPEFTQTHVHRVCDAIQPSHPLSSPSPPAPNPSQNESTLCMRWPKYWSFSFSIIPSKEHPGLISFEMQIRMK